MFIKLYEVDVLNVQSFYLEWFFFLFVLLEWMIMTVFVFFYIYFRERFCEKYNNKTTTRIVNLMVMEIVLFCLVAGGCRKYMEEIFIGIIVILAALSLYIHFGSAIPITVIQNIYLYITHTHTDSHTMCTTYQRNILIFLLFIFLRI